ncbi:MAG: hypothetical protein JWP97_5512 [Labilithrix sp.]|nr:hypothetical protein [Labilithrix sp.]
MKARVALLLALAACNAKSDPAPRPAPSDAPASPSAIASVLGLDAGLFAEAVDPPAPAGDLKSDLDRFVNVETCVKERANVDPLVGDALSAIGYDTFLRDACRLLETAKDRKADACERIDASAMRGRCKAWVAMVTQAPDACPLVFDGVPTRGRSATCVAVAGKDPRLCAAEPRASSRATCEALASRDQSHCDKLLPGERPGCVRELTRWRSMLAAPLAGLPPLTTPHGKLTVHGEGGTPDPAAPETDLTTDLARGAVVVTSRNRARLELGMVGAVEPSRIAPSPNRRPRLGVAVVLEPGAAAKDAGRPLLERLELEVPGEATLVYPGVHCDCKVTAARADRARGGEVTIAVTGTISAGSRSYTFATELSTWVRDVVDDQASAGSRVIPAAHPFVPSAGTVDGGLR